MKVTINITGQLLKDVARISKYQKLDYKDTVHTLCVGGVMHYHNIILKQQKREERANKWYVRMWKRNRIHQI